LERKLHELGRVFDHYDTDKSGLIDVSELQHLMESLGMSLDKQQAEEMLNVLDVNNDGDVSREEFLDWQLEQMEQSKTVSPEKMAEDLFDMFDDDNSGSLTVTEFREKMEANQVGLSDDDIFALIDELDENRDGTIDREEFSVLIKKHYDDSVGVLGDAAKF